MSELRFDGRVAVVTGAGGGMGRAHALTLAERGAKVVVNDLAGGGQPAARVVEEITAAGGTAIESTDDISEQASASKLIARAVEAFGRIDILVNNAAIIGLFPFAELEAVRFDLSMKVNAYGPFYTAQAAWPQMVEQGYGRIVNISSAAGLFGLPDRVDYGASKAAVIGLTRSLAADGDGFGIATNGVFPSAITRLSSAPQRARYAERFTMEEDDLREKTPRLVSAMVGWLSHEECAFNGEIFEAGEGHYRRLLIGASAGYDDNDATIETVRDHLAEITDTGGFEPRAAYKTRAAWPTADLLQTSR
jgi:NAD(P)-dependent dehydrogenase (short-subunit alcohol dehydrogenase family)